MHVAKPVGELPVDLFRKRCVTIAGSKTGLDMADGNFSVK